MHRLETKVLSYAKVLIVTIPRIVWDEDLHITQKITKAIRTQQVLLLDDPTGKTTGEKTQLRMEERAQIHHASGSKVHPDSIPQSYKSKTTGHFITYQRCGELVLRHNDKKTNLYHERILEEHQRKPTLILLTQQPELHTPACEAPQ
jgi:hypothetical protein